MPIEGTEKFIQAAHALNELGDRDVRLAVYKGFREAATPLGDSMVEALASDMPKRGGLAARVAASKPSIRNATTGRNPRVEISLRGAKNAAGKNTALQPMEDGKLKHPVFARKGSERKTWRWVQQAVPGGAAGRAFEEGAPAVRERLIHELNSVIDDAARKV